MQLNILYLIGISAFFLVFLSFLLSPTKNQSRVGLWLGLMTLFFAVLISSWEVDDLALRWVLIEASTLIGALLVSLPRTRKALEVAWKFLLINSFGLGIAFLGIIIVSFGVHTQVTLSSKVLLEQVASHQNVFVELGLWLAIFGYSAKLGLFPNHFWVSDTYAESPSQVSAIIAAFVPVSVCLALRPLVRMDQLLTPHIFSAANGFLLLGMMTMIYSLWTLYQTHDIRRISAQIGLFHSGTLAVFLWYDPSDEILYFALGTTILVKSFLFTTMGILRMDSGTRTIDRILIMEGLNRVSSILYIGALCFAFVLPLSPIFITDLMFLKLGLTLKVYWVFAVPVLGLVFFAICFDRMLSILNVPSRKFLPEVRKALTIRVVLAVFLLGITVSLGVWGIYIFSAGGFGNV